MESPRCIFSRGGGIGVELYPTIDFGSEPYLIEIGNNVRINNRVTFVTHDGGVWVLRNLYSECTDIDLFGRIKIGNNVHIGTAVIVMPGVTIGDNCIIGCGAVVTHDIPENSIAVGVPAKVIEDLSIYYKKHEKDFDHTKRLQPKEKENYLRKKYEIKRE